MKTESTGNTFKNMRKTFQNIAIEHIKRKKQQNKKTLKLKFIENIRIKPLIVILFFCGAVFSAFSLVCSDKNNSSETNNQIIKIEKPDDLFICTSAYINEILNKIKESGFNSIQKEWLKSTPPEIREDAEIFLNNTALNNLHYEKLSQNKTNGVFTMFCSLENSSFKIKIKRNPDSSFNLVAIE